MGDPFFPFSLFSPDRGEVFEFENGFFDKYRLDPNKYQLNDLRPVPGNDHDLWMKAPQDGYRHLN